MTIKENPRISETMYVIRNDIEYRSLPKSLSKNLLSVQKLSKYFTVSTEAAIQIKSLFFAYIYFLKSANQSLILHFGFVLYNISCLFFFLKKAIYMCFNQSFGHNYCCFKADSQSICMIKGPCIIWYAPKCSVHQPK